MLHRSMHLYNLSKIKIKLAIKKYSSLKCGHSKIIIINIYVIDLEHDCYLMLLFNLDLFIKK